MDCANCDHLTAMAEERLDKVLSLADRLAYYMEKDATVRNQVARIRDCCRDHETLDDDIKANRLREIFHIVACMR